MTPDRRMPEDLARVAIDAALCDTGSALDQIESVLRDIREARDRPAAMGRAWSDVRAACAAC